MFSKQKIVQNDTSKTNAGGYVLAKPGGSVKVLLWRIGVNGYRD